MGALDKLETIGVLGVLAGAGYIIWSNWDKIVGFFQNPFGTILPGSCPTGYYETLGGCCPNGTVFENGVCKIIDIPSQELQRDEHGCLIGTQHWCQIDNSCRDIAQSCTPGVSPGPCYEWSPTFGQWIYSPTMSGCQDSINCSNPAMPYYCEVDGTCRGSAAACPTEPYIPPVVIPSGEMTVREIYISKMLRGFEPSVDDCNYIHKMDDEFYHELKQGGRCWGIDFVPHEGQCPDGSWVDLSSGVSLEQACYRDPVISDKGDCVRELLGSAPGFGSTCGPECPWKISNEGWFDVPGTGCCNSPRTHWAWQQCGGY